MTTAGIKTGDERRYSFQVKEDDVASFHGEPVHPVCATYTLAREIEYASRLFVLDMKERHEEGVGTELSIEHVSPAFPGETVDIVATLDQLTETEVICTYEARVGNRLVATGKTGQKVLPRKIIESHFARIRGDSN